MAPELGSDSRELSEETLVQRAAGGDRTAFGQLVTRHADRLFASLRRLGLDDAEAQEVAQETVLRAWRALPRFEGRSRFSTWLYRIGFNEAQRRLARRPAAGAMISTDEQPGDAQADERPGPAARAESAELRGVLVRALGELPLDLRVAVVLRDIEGLSIQEAASVLELREGAFKSRLHRGRLALRALLAPLTAAGEL